MRPRAQLTEAGPRRTRRWRRELLGIVYAVAQRGRLHVNTIGRSTLDGTEPMRRGAPCRIASLTKPVIAAATIMLVEEGRLALVEEAGWRWTSRSTACCQSWLTGGCSIGPTGRSTRRHRPCAFSA